MIFKMKFQTFLRYSLCLFLLVASNSANAFGMPGMQVLGEGKTQEEAINHALSKATEIKNGLLVVSKSGSVNGELTEDSIKTLSTGKVKKYDVLESRYVNGVYKVIISVEVEDWAVWSTPVSIKSDWTQVKVATDLQENLKNQAAFLSDFLGDRNYLIENAYEIYLADIVVDQVRPDSISGEYRVKIRQNAAFWSNYQRILESLSKDDHEGTMVDGLISKIRDHTPGCNYCLGISISDKRLPSSIGNYLAKPIRARISVSGSSQIVYLFKNTVILMDDRYTRKIEQQFFEGYTVLTVGDATLSPVFGIHGTQLKKLPVDWEKGTEGLYRTALNTTVAIASNHDNYYVKLPFSVRSSKELLKDFSIKVSSYE